MRILDNGIMHTVFYKGTFLEVIDIKDVQIGYESLPDPKPMKVIQEMEIGVSMSLEARKYAAEHSPDLIGIAYVIKGLAQRLLIRFYVKMWKRKKPVKVFDSFDEAETWLMSI
tara:strand:+ start:1239 stop:1577 length:339 start_codon:yes stop_codon:yes gene_type:complete